MEGIGTQIKKNLNHMTKKHSKKTLELGKLTIFGRWGEWAVSQIHEKKNCECWSLFHVPPPPWTQHHTANIETTVTKRQSTLVRWIDLLINWALNVSRLLFEVQQVALTDFKLGSVFRMRGTMATSTKSQSQPSSPQSPQLLSLTRSFGVPSIAQHEDKSLNAKLTWSTVPLNAHVTWV